MPRKLLPSCGRMPRAFSDCTAAYTSGGIAMVPSRNSSRLGHRPRNGMSDWPRSHRFFQAFNVKQAVFTAYQTGNSRLGRTHSTANISPAWISQW